MLVDSPEPSSMHTTHCPHLGPAPSSWSSRGGMRAVGMSLVGGGGGVWCPRQLDRLPGCVSTDCTQLGPGPREDTRRWLPLSQELCNPSGGPDTGGPLDVGRPHRLQAQKTIPATCPRCPPRSPARCGPGWATARAQQLCPWLHTLLQASRPRRGATWLQRTGSGEGQVWPRSRSTIQTRCLPGLSALLPRLSGGVAFARV